MKDKDETAKPERIAKYLARAGLCSRRDAERLIAAGRITLNGAVLTTPAVTVTGKDTILFDGTAVAAKEPTRLWRYHKPRGLVTTHRDEQDRATIFDHLPDSLPRVISVGRLDLNSEGLLMLTNDGTLSRHLELPATGLPREYRVRAFGTLDDAKIRKLAAGITVEGINYGPIKAMVERQQGDNVWIAMTLHEGKNREIRRVLDHLGLAVNRLIRVSYGAFKLDDLPEGAVAEVPAAVVVQLMKDIA